MGADLLTRASVDPAVFAAQPGYVAALVVADGVANGPSDAAADALLRDASERLRAGGLARAADDPHIAAWRAAFSAFGAKPSRFLCSAEALAGRVLKGGELPRINRLVDLYNAVSVRHLIPVGGEDALRLDGAPRLVIAEGAEAFDGDDGPPRPGEVVWRDDTGVTCRRWNWRQGRRTALTESTESALFIFDRLEPLPLRALERAVDDLVQHLREGWPDCRVDHRLLDSAA
jgi:DNA/RNA-binding domain of Phe-tRNA-synthetase-like protein